MFVLSIFEDISRRSDVLDVAELKQYLENERHSLIHVLSLVRSGVMTLPVVNSDFVPELSQSFSISRAVICCHILSSSAKLNELFNRYENQGMPTRLFYSYILVNKSSNRSSNYKSNWISENCRRML